MAQQDLQNRVENLERQVEILTQLPGRVTALESQILQFREEMRGEFSALRSELRAEIRAGDEAIRVEIGDLRSQMLLLHEEVISRIKLLGERWKGRSKPR